jgi:hypothetical protein
MTRNTNEKLTENASEYESWFFRLSTSKQRRRTQVGPWAAAQTFSQKYWHFRPFSGRKKLRSEYPISLKIFLINLGPHKRISKHRTPLASKIKKIKWNLLVALSLQNNRQKLFSKSFFLDLSTEFFQRRNHCQCFFSKLSKRNFCLGSDAKTIFLGYFNRKTLALWKITSNKLIEKTKSFKAIFLWTIFKNEWCNNFEKMLSKRAIFRNTMKIISSLSDKIWFTGERKKCD